MPPSLIPDLEEDRIGKIYDQHLFKRLLKYLQPYRGLVIVCVILLLFATALELAGPFLVGKAVDTCFVQEKENFHKIWFFISLYLLVLIFTFILGYVQTVLMFFIAQHVILDLRMQLFSHLQNLSNSFFDKQPVGRLMTRQTGDVEVLNELFASGFVTVIGDFFVVGGIVAAMFVLNAQLAATILIIVPMLLSVSILFGNAIRKTYRTIREKLAKINAYLQELITGMQVVQAFSQEHKCQENFSNINRDHLHAYLKTVSYYALFYPAVELIGSAAIALILWFGGGEVIKNLLTFGTLIAFIQYINRFFRPVRDLAEKFNLFQAAMASAERIFTLLDTKDFILDVPKVSIKQIKGNIRFENVSFAYRDNIEVLKNISFQVEAGETAAIVGATGAGKTTIINLLNRFYEVSQGRILIDNVDIKNLALDELRSYFGNVSQDVFLFSGSVEDNIRLGSEDISEEEIIAACQQVNAHSFIQKLPNGYKENIKERGSLLSAGQRQLLSFARALVRKPSILLLDEATSSVDIYTESLIQDALRKLFQGGSTAGLRRTCIIVAHRLFTIKHATKIILMHKGQVCDIGRHEELLSRNSIYQKLYYLQYKDQKILVTNN